MVLKSDGRHQSFDRAKIVAGVALAAKGRPVPEAVIEAIAADVEETVRLEGPQVTSERIGRAVLEEALDASA